MSQNDSLVAETKQQITTNHCLIQQLQTEIAFLKDHSRRIEAMTESLRTKFQALTETLQSTCSNSNKKLLLAMEHAEKKVRFFI